MTHGEAEEEVIRINVDGSRKSDSRSMGSGMDDDDKTSLVKNAADF
jgi:hypothetical protein